MRQWKTSALFAVLLVIVLRGMGQFKVSDSLVHLSFFKVKDFRPEKLEFDKVMIVDNRLDTSRFISIEVSNQGTPLELRFDTIATSAIQVYIDKITRGIPRTPNELVISLHRYQLFQHRNFFFSADAYVKSNSGNYVKLFTVDTLWSKHAYDFLTGRAIAEFIMNVNSSINSLKDLPNIKEVSLQEIQADKVYKQWANYPVVKNPANGRGTGFYLSYWRFRDDNLDSVNLEMSMNPDSTYRLIILDNSKETRRKIFTWSQIPRIPLRYRGALYIKLYGVIVEMKAQNNTFYFKIPPGYPDMFTYALAMQAYYNSGGTSSPSNLLDLTNSIIGNQVSKSILKSSDKSSTALKNVYYDMESGLMIYHKNNIEVVGN